MKMKTLNQHCGQIACLELACRRMDSILALENKQKVTEMLFLFKEKYVSGSILRTWIKHRATVAEDRIMSHTKTNCIRKLPTC